MILIAAAALLATPQPPAPGARPEPAPTAVVRGIVLAADGRPLRQATVTLVDRPSGRRVGAYTDADARFEFARLPAGSYLATASKAGYAAMEFGQRKPTDPATRIVVRAGQTIERIDFMLPRAAAISGRVVDENGDPIEGASVTAYTVQYVDGRRQLTQARASRQTTNDIGGYRLFSLEPGEYVVRASVATSGPFQLPGYPASYYPGSSNAADAQIVSVGPADNLPGVDVRVTPAPVATISGVALDPGGQPFRGFVSLRTTQRSGAVAMPAERVQPRADGRFAFRSVTPGDYVVSAFNIARYGPEFAAQFLSVGSGDVDGVTIRTGAGATMSGRVSFAGDRTPAPEENLSLDLVSVDADLSPEGGALGVRLSPFDEWTFEVKGLFGPRLIRTAGSDWVVQSVRVNGDDITDTPIPFGRAGDSLTDVEVVITNRGAAVTGGAVDSRAQSVGGYTAVVFSADNRRWTVHSRFVKAARAEADGTFMIHGLPAGDYLVAAVNRIQTTDKAGEWQDPAFLEMLAPNATRATLIEGETVSVAVRLTMR